MMLDVISIFLNLPRLNCDPRYDLSWRMFHVHLRRKCILYLLDGMSYKYQLSPSGLMCHLKLVSPYLFSVWISVHWCKWDVKIPNYYCVTFDFPFCGC